MLLKKISIKQLLPPPVTVAHGEYSMILSAHDDEARPTNSLLKTSLAAIEQAMHVNLEEISERIQSGPRYATIWPGEHYRLLAGFMLALDPKVVIEIGTATGLSALCMKQHLSVDAELVTFDIVPWDEYPNTILNETDFNQQFQQRLADLSDLEQMMTHLPLLERADFVFVDGPHNGEFEETFLKNLGKILNTSKTIYICFDDIRVWKMLKMWREVQFPKIDLTSFGHWSGTGLIEWRC